MHESDAEVQVHVCFGSRKKLGRRFDLLLHLALVLQVLNSLDLHHELFPLGNRLCKAHTNKEESVLQVLELVFLSFGSLPQLQQLFYHVLYIA
jgi:hypothetical protein